MRKDENNADINICGRKDWNICHPTFNRRSTSATRSTLVASGSLECFADTIRFGRPYYHIPVCFRESREREEQREDVQQKVMML